ncbi:MAG: hypothetical protein HY042_10900, partial [Spirochaetia bacterium]|nr:hypothetical protein [Spirochaetia bacterium]
MFRVLLVTFLSYVLCMGLGAFVMELAAPATFRRRDTVLVWAGIVALGLITYVWCLFLPLDKRAQIVIVLLAACGLVLFRSTIRAAAMERLRSLSNPYQLLLFVAVLVLVCVQGVEPPGHGDTGLYHAPLIKWLQTWGGVPGIAHLHTRFGYQSVVFPISTVLDSGRGNFYLFDLLVLILFLQALDAYSAGRDRLAALLPLLVWGGALLYLYLYISSPAPDNLVVIAGVSAALFLSSDSPDKMTIVSLLAALLCATKPTAFPLGALGAFALYALWRQSKRTSLIVGAVGLVLLGAHFIHCVRASGFLVYPVAWLHLPFDWALPAVRAMEESRVNTAWARMPGVPAEQVLSMPFGEWFPLWWGRLLPREAFLFLGAVISAAVFPILWLVGGAAIRARHDLAVIFMACLSGFVLWFLAAPDVRFGYVYLLLMSQLLLAAGLALAPKAPLPPWAGKLGVLTLAGVVGWAGISHGWLILSFYPNAYARPVAAAPTEPFVSRPMQGFLLKIPVGEISGRCWYIEPPCAQNEPSSLIRLRWASLASGFAAV